MMFNKSRFETDVISTPHLHYFYGASGVDSTTISETKTTKIQTFMDQMIQGHYRSPTDGSTVSHHACRGKGKAAAIQTISECMASIEPREFNTICHIGIGGSISGAKWLSQSLGACKTKSKPIVFISNHDEEHIKHTLKNINIEKTLFIVVSKSGTTVEIHSILSTIFLIQNNPKFFKEQCITVTTPNSPLDTSDYFKRYTFDSGVGGRFSSTSLASLITLGLSFGLDVIDELLTGAQLADDHARKPWPSNISLTQAIIRFHQQQTYHGLAFISYGHAMNHLSNFAHQLISESLGKSIHVNGESTKTNPAPFFIPGTGPEAQHSFFQQLHQGMLVAPCEFVCAAPQSVNQKHLLKQIIGQMISLADGEQNPNQALACSGKRPSSLMVIQSLSPASIGYFISTLENRVIFEGLLHNINPFNQPGVELGKKITQLVDEPGSKAKKTFEFVMRCCAPPVE